MIEDRRKAFKDLSDATPGQGVASELHSREELDLRLQTIGEEIANLRSTFEQLATGGADESVFTTEPAQKFDWQAEIVEISKPIFDELRALTEKPRQIERLKRTVELARIRIESAQKGLTAIRASMGAPLEASVADRLAGLEADWRQRQREAAQALEVAQLQLANLQEEEPLALERLQEQALEFVQGRGVTLLLAVVVAVSMWALLQLPRRYVERRARRRSDGSNLRYRLLLYANRLITVVFVVLGLLVTFSAMGDFLLLTLTIIGMALAVLSLRRFLPQYIAEARLLLGLGPVREGERIVIDGLPFEVKTINVYCVLRNPCLEGVLRLPLHELIGQRSRPCREEPWFPSRAGDCILMPDDSFATVNRQTLEFVELIILGGIRRLVSNTDYVALAIRNLTQGGTFAVPVTFGIDYRHQSECLHEVAPKLQAHIEACLSDTPFAEHLERLVVEFRMAGTNSLDYLVAAIFRSSAASSYPAIVRKLWQACVLAANEEGWGIPFTQLTIHPAEGSEPVRLLSHSQ
ncbi:MAG: hypothetical protein KDK91_13100 [Gammaproteobacteria bacterium]|nr:hypothetical protein [Gammaproteobacteria bacterium]